MIEPDKVKGAMLTAWETVRDELIIEAKHTCQSCEQRLWKLHVHHQDACGLNTRLDNLVVLCDDCHRIVHNQTGRQGKRLYKPKTTVGIDKLRETYEAAHPRAYSTGA